MKEKALFLLLVPHQYSIFILLFRPGRGRDYNDLNEAEKGHERALFPPTKMISTHPSGDAIPVD